MLSPCPETFDLHGSTRMTLLDHTKLRIINTGICVLVPAPIRQASISKNAPNHCRVCRQHRSNSKPTTSYLALSQLIGVGLKGLNNVPMSLTSSLVHVHLLLANGHDTCFLASMSSHGRLNALGQISSQAGLRKDCVLSLLQMVSLIMALPILKIIGWKLKELGFACISSLALNFLSLLIPKLVRQLLNGDRILEKYRILAFLSLFMKMVLTVVMSRALISVTHQLTSL